MSKYQKYIKGRRRYLKKYITNFYNKLDPSNENYYTGNKITDIKNLLNDLNMDEGLMNKVINYVKSINSKK